MSRSGYSDDHEPWELIKWRGQVLSALRGKRGQRFLQELLAALDALPEKKLVRGDLQDESGCVCTLGAVLVKRGVSVETVDTYDYEQLGVTFDIAHQLSQEIMYENDECGWHETPEQRFQRMRKWVVDNLKQTPPSEIA